MPDPNPQLMNNLDAKVFFFELPLYTSIKIGETNRNDFALLIQGSDTVDYYNPYIGENSTFQRKNINSGNVAEYYRSVGGIIAFIWFCKRTSIEFYFYAYYNISNNTFMKVGQYPSVADFHISQIKQYNKVLSKEKLKEFTRAIGLAANGVGIGSFVYLRRIFEGLIEEAHSKALKEQDWDNTPYHKARMADKIDLLSDYLPSFLVENKELYGILSVGVHGLTEEDCLAYFETVKVGIELILDEKLEAFDKNKKLEDAKAKLGALNNKLKGGQ